MFKVSMGNVIPFVMFSCTSFIHVHMQQWRVFECATIVLAQFWQINFLITQTSLWPGKKWRSLKIFNPHPSVCICEDSVQSKQSNEWADGMANFQVSSHFQRKGKWWTNIEKYFRTQFRIEGQEMQPFLPRIRSHTSDAYSRAVLLSMLSPVVSGVTKHQQVACKPIRAAVASLRSHGSDFGPPPKIHFQPLVRVWGERRPASSTCNKDRQCFSRVYVWAFKILFESGIKK